MGENAVAQQIWDAAFRVHTTLGPGLLESVYEAALSVRNWKSAGCASLGSKASRWSTRQVRIHARVLRRRGVEDW